MNTLCLNPRPPGCSSIFQPQAPTPAYLSKLKSTRLATWSSGGCRPAGEGENPRGTYVIVEMQEVGQHSGGHVREGGQECLEISF